MKKKYFIGLFSGVLLIVLGTWGQAKNAATSEISEEGLNELFHQVLYHVKRDYVEDIESKEIWYGAIKGMLTALNDAHTRFMPPEELNELKVGTRGKFGGLGIEVTVRDNVLTVISPIEDTPAMRAGLQPNDKIVEINKKPTRNMTLLEAVKLMRGTPGTSINLSIAREGESDLLYFDIIRDIIKIKITQSEIIQPHNIGYIKLKQFSQSAYTDMRKILKEFKRKKIKGLILDLRWNPGGLLESAHKVTNLFIKKGVIVSTRGRKKQLDRVFTAKPNMAIVPDLPLVLLGNEGSASASEITAGAIKDHKRGIFIGVKTFGKGSVQNVIPLRYNTAVALTIQKYYTPSGKSIHKKGIEPDIHIKALEFTRLDHRNYIKLKEKKIIDDFVKKHSIYNKVNITKFNKILKEKKLPLSDYASKFLLKRKIIEKSGKKGPVFDLELDVQLKKQLNI